MNWCLTLISSLFIFPKGDSAIFDEQMFKKFKRVFLLIRREAS